MTCINDSIAFYSRVKNFAINGSLNCSIRNLFFQLLPKDWQNLDLGINHFVESWARLLFLDAKEIERPIVEIFDPLSKTDVNNLQNEFEQPNTSMAIMYIPMETIIGDPIPPYAPWNAPTKFALREHQYGKIRKLAFDQLPALKKMKVLGTEADVVIFSIGQWYSAFVRFDDFVNHLEVELNRLSEAYHSVTFVFILPVAFSGRGSSLPISELMFACWSTCFCLTFLLISFALSIIFCSVS